MVKHLSVRVVVLEPIVVKRRHIRRSRARGPNMKRRLWQQPLKIKAGGRKLATIKVVDLISIGCAA